jgi:hypothetical protein
LTICENIFSGSATKVITNSEIEKHNQAATTEFTRLHEKAGGFSFWNTPRHFVATEKNHSKDGIHFAWPDTIAKVDLVVFL